MSFADPFAELDYLGGRVFQRTQYQVPVAFRDGQVLKPIRSDFVHGDDHFPFLFDQGPYFLQVGRDGSRRVHPTRELDRYFELGPPSFFLRGVWFRYFFSPLQLKNSIVWTGDYMSMVIRNDGHKFKLDIELKNGFIPPDNLVAFPFRLVGLHRAGSIVYDGIHPVMQFQSPVIYDAADPERRSLVPFHFLPYQGRLFLFLQLPEIRAWSRPVIDPTWLAQPAESVAKDTYLSAAATTTNYGTAATLLCYLNNRHTLLQFDLSSIPTYAACLAATLSLFSASSLGGGSMVVYSLHSNVADWVESEATWVNYKAGTAWPGSSGASTSGTDYETLGLGSIVYPTLSVDTEAQSSLSKTRVAGWWASPSTNYGMLIQGVATSRDWHSSSAASAALRPKLTVVYKVPEPSVVGIKAGISL